MITTLVVNNVKQARYSNLKIKIKCDYQHFIPENGKITKHYLLNNFLVYLHIFLVSCSIFF